MPYIPVQFLDLLLRPETIGRPCVADVIAMYALQQQQLDMHKARLIQMAHI